ncbi:unnamed protein product [Taenia asiatica]|uniref:Mitochondrial import inner membrane translocase subunit TIM16 n=1 Tax=Taenia asiatica TaxID=60517 RepID=A0A0R3W1A3_TAEAS|nr:unnamed protein product [Taenia asiatica]
MILSVSRILGRAFAKALQEEYAASKNAARLRANADKSSSKSDFGSCLSGISLEEAKQILNISDIYNAEEVARKYDYLFNVNDKKNGGSFYLQSKVFRAKERIDEEIQAKSSSSEV